MDKKEIRKLIRERGRGEARKILQEHDRKKLDDILYGNSPLSLPYRIWRAHLRAHNPLFPDIAERAGLNEELRAILDEILQSPPASPQLRLIEGGKEDE
jgi:hypothetical protein